MERKRTGIGWTWGFQDFDGNWVLCNWADPYKEWLLQKPDDMPCDDAVLVRVELVPTSKRNRKRYGYS